MRNRIATVVVLLSFVSSGAYAQRELGVGVIVGEPTGLSAKYWLDNEQAIAGAAAWSFSGTDSFHLHADYLVHRFDLIDTPEESGETALYYGVGARLKEKGRHDRTTLGVRIPVGVTHLFANAPFDVFGEIVPVLDVAPDVGVKLNAAVGLRFYFR